MLIYHYDRDTFAYLGSSEARPSPLEPGKFLIPAYATELMPPSPAQGQIATFNEQTGAWSLVPSAEPEEPEPGPDVPQQVTMRQARLALLGAGLLGSVENAIDGLDSPLKEAARIEWEYAAEVDRHSPTMQMLAAGLELSDAQLDALFTAAAEL